VLFKHWGLLPSAAASFVVMVIFVEGVKLITRLIERHNARPGGHRERDDSTGM
jgi:hypothetical protein